MISLQDMKMQKALDKGCAQEEEGEKTHPVTYVHEKPHGDFYLAGRSFARGSFFSVMVGKPLALSLFNWM